MTVAPYDPSHAGTYNIGLVMTLNSYPSTVVEKTFFYVTIRGNTSPYFVTPPPTLITISLEQESFWTYIFPATTDAESDPVFITVDVSGAPYVNVYSDRIEIPDVSVVPIGTYSL